MKCANSQANVSILLKMRKQIGEFYVERGVLTPAQVEEILAFARKTGLRFGEAGLELGLLNEHVLEKMFGPSYHVDFFYLDARYYPTNTKDWLTLEQIIRFGALPLGLKTTSKWLFKRERRLNLGMLTPSKELVDGIEKELRAQVGGKFEQLKVFLLLGDQFLNVLKTRYGVNEGELARRPAGSVHPALALLLDASEFRENG